MMEMRNRSLFPHTSVVLFWDAASLRVAVVEDDVSVRWLLSCPADAEGFASAARAVAALRLPEGAPCVVGLPPTAGGLMDDVLFWQHPRANEAFTIAEARAVRHSIDARGREALRREGYDSASAEVFENRIVRLRADGRRVGNPVGFPVKTLAVHARQTFLWPEAAAAMRALREELASYALRPLLLDDALATLTLARTVAPDTAAADFVLVVSENATVALRFADGVLAQRSVFALGQEGARAAFMREVSLSSADEAERLLDAAGKGLLSSALERRVQRATAPYLSTWARLVRASGCVPSGKDTATVDWTGRPVRWHVRTAHLIAATHLRTPLSRTLEPKFLGKLFPTFPAIPWQVSTIAHMLDHEETAPADTLQVLALARAAQFASRLPA